jgi:hypothetical protein
MGSELELPKTYWNAGSALYYVELIKWRDDPGIPKGYRRLAPINVTESPHTAMAVTKFALRFLK